MKWLEWQTKNKYGHQKLDEEVTEADIITKEKEHLVVLENGSGNKI